MALLTLSACGHDPEPGLMALDEAVENHAANIRRYGDELRREGILSQQPSLSDDRRMAMYRGLRLKYQTFDMDSAIYYGRKEYELAESWNRESEMARKAMSLARLYVSRGELHEAMTLIMRHVNDTVIPEVLDGYYRALADVLVGQGVTPVDVYEHMMKYMSPTDEGRWFYELRLCEGTGQYERADSVILHSKQPDNASDRDKAIYSYLEAELKLLEGDTVSAIEPLIMSSLYDLKVPVRDYQSLFLLSELLLKRGDTDRAYRYIKLAMADAGACKVIANQVRVNALFPTVLAAYEQQVNREQRNERIAIAGITVMLLVLLVVLAFVARQRNQLRRVSQNERLLISQLKSYNSELSELNARLKDSNKVRDTYLLQYLRLSSEFVRDIEKLKMGVSSAFHKKGMDGVNKFLAEIDDKKETKRFLSNFDSTFLGLYPDFVEEVNRDLKPECRLSLSRDGSMGTDLRVMALIRLGIVSSDQIAEFLHKSLSTIYNCRVRLKNARIDSDRGYQAAFYSGQNGQISMISFSKVSRLIARFRISVRLLNMVCWE